MIGAAQISIYIFATIVVVIPLAGLIKKVPIFESFIAGGKHGFDLIIKIIPFIVGMYVAIDMLQASGFFDLVLEYFAPALLQVGFHQEMLPLALVRPISGSASIALLDDIITRYGPDSLSARTAATIFGSTETTFYVIAVYFGAVGIKHYRHALATGLIADAAGIIASIIVCYFMFG